MMGDGYFISANGIVYTKSGFEPPSSVEVGLCREWITLFGYPRATFNRKIGSYWLKHAVEHWAGEYVSNGAFIKAALDLGYRVSPISDSPNAYFNITLPKDKYSMLDFGDEGFGRRNEENIDYRFIKKHWNAKLLKCNDCGWCGQRKDIVTVETKNPYKGCPNCYSRRLVWNDPLIERGAI